MTEFPRTEPTSYAFTYADTATYEEELDEWFAYSEAEYGRVREAQRVFGQCWRTYSNNKQWVGAEKDEQAAFIKREILRMGADDAETQQTIHVVHHLVLGVWEETAGGTDERSDDEVRPKTQATKPHIAAMVAGVQLLVENGGLQPMYDSFQMAMDTILYVKEDPVFGGILTVIGLSSPWGHNPRRPMPASFMIK